MGREDDTTRTPGRAADRGPESAGTTETAGGALSRLEPYVRRGTRSGVIAAAVGILTLLRGAGSLLRRNWRQAIVRLGVGAGWLVVAFLQRRSRGVPGVGQDDVVEPPTGRVGGPTDVDETPIAIDEPGPDGPDVSGEAETIDEIGTEDEEPMDETDEGVEPVDERPDETGTPTDEAEPMDDIGITVDEEDLEEREGESDDGDESEDGDEVE